MAQKLFSKDVLTLTREAAEALTAFRFVKAGTDTAEVDMCDTIGEVPLAVTDCAWAEGDEAVGLNYAGCVYVQAGGTVAVGDAVCTDASGRAIKAAGTLGPVAVAGMAMTAGDSGDLITVQLAIAAGAVYASNGAGSATLVIPVPITAVNTEVTTGVSLPAKCIVNEVVLDVITAEATGGTKTLDVGTMGTSNDPNGFMVGISAAATGLIVPQLTNAAVTRGALMTNDEDGAGALVPIANGACGGDPVSITLGSADWVECVANLIFNLTVVD